MRFSKKKLDFFIKVFQDGDLEEELGRNSHTDSILLRKILGASNSTCSIS